MSFGPFELDPVRRALTCNGAPVKIAAKQVDALRYFLENPGRLIDKDELLAALWPGRIAEESSLTQTIFLLRRALGTNDSDRYIVTFPGRGYCFVAAVVRVTAGTHAMATQAGTLLQPLSPAAPPSLMPPLLPPRDRPLWRSGQARRIAWIGTMAALLITVISLPMWRRSAGPAVDLAFKPPAHSVAVLAFTNMSGDPAQDYFSSGVSEELINALSRIDALQVAARMSAFTFKDGTATMAKLPAS